MGLIVDGARRWARANRIGLKSAYDRAFASVEVLVRNLFENDVSEISLYLLSRDNLKRSASDLEAVFAASASFVDGALLDLSRELGVGIKIAGDPTSVSTAYQASLRKAEQETRHLTGRQLYLLVAYSPAEELADRGGPHLTTMDSLISNLWVPSRVDLVIRTGGAALLSDFLPLQCGYARIWWTPKSFVDLAWDDIENEVQDVKRTEQLRGR
ncbi:undecaprenyl diphosphate synthase family protein [Leifsonia sp. LS-T14]|uniref:undecaprenyl diphosphate synthase family protein n=1 Tax=unclassified Leifsonia TaxID=2663824 RepID=UPI0035A6CDC9